jgi:hypothetical protein
VHHNASLTHSLSHQSSFSLFCNFTNFNDSLNSCILPLCRLHQRHEERRLTFNRLLERQRQMQRTTTTTTTTTTTEKTTTAAMEDASSTLSPGTANKNTSSSSKIYFITSISFGALLLLSLFFNLRHLLDLYPPCSACMACARHVRRIVLGNQALRNCTAESLAMSHRQLREEEEAQEEADAALAEMQQRLTAQGGPIVRSNSGSSIGSVEDLVRAAGAQGLEEGSLATVSTAASNATSPLLADVTVESPPPPPPSSSSPPLLDASSQSNGDD